MISVESARQLLTKHIPDLPSETIALEKALGRVVASSVKASIDLPSFDMSAMDGYALAAPLDGLSYQLVGEIKAGDAHHPTLQPGEAVRIFTGAAVPASCVAVEMQEKVSVNNEKLTLETSVEAGRFIRKKGGQVRQGQTIFESGYVLNPAAIGLLANMGIDQVEVVHKPAIHLIATGNELVPPGKPLQRGQLYESNLVTLQTALQGNGFYAEKAVLLPDDYNIILQAFEQALAQADLLIVSGGISVGDYDFTAKALKELGVTALFHGVAQKPGKPLFVGQKGKKLIFGLPGNPASALVCYYLYLLPALHQMTLCAPHGLKLGEAPTSEEIKGIHNKTQFLRGSFDGERLYVATGQESHMLLSFAKANVLVEIPPTSGMIPKGTHLKYYLLPTTN